MDTRHFEAAGRRWRRSDPAIPEPLRQALVNELMAARRAVRAALAQQVPTAERRARDRVQDAKVALGERGRAWWLEPDAAADRARLAAAMAALLRSRRAGATICPSEAARVAGGEDWRRCMPAARALAFELQEQGILQVLQRGRAVGPGTRGPIRLALPADQAPG